MSKDYYLAESRLNLLALSRTAKDGIIDITASGHDMLPLCKENYADRSSVIAALEDNSKARVLEITNLLTKSKEDIKKLVRDNFKIAMDLVWDEAIKIKLRSADNLLSGDDSTVKMKEFVLTVAKRIGKGIVKEDYTLRRHDSPKFLYAKADTLEIKLGDFVNKLVNKLRQGIDIENDSTKKRDWARKTAAWIEYRINLTDHLIGDGCGKTSAAISALPLMLASVELPTFCHRDEYFSKAHLLSYERDDFENESDDEQYVKWEIFFLTHFTDYKIQVSDAVFSEKYYVQSAIRNLTYLSKTARDGFIGTDGSKDKSERVESIIDGSLYGTIVNAEFHERIKLLYSQNRKEFDNDTKLKKFVIDNVVIPILTDGFKGRINSAMSIEDKIKVCLRTKDPDSTIIDYNNTPHSMLLHQLNIFFLDLHKRLCYGKDHFKTAAWVEYSMHYKNHFFCDGNKRIAAALSYFVLMRKNLPLPIISSEMYFEDDGRTRSTGYTFENAQQDLYFQRWLVSYKSRFKVEEPSAAITNAGIPTILPTDPWRIEGNPVTVTGTILDADNITSPAEISKLRHLTKLSSEELVVFKAKRMVLHEIITCLSIRYVWDERSFPGYIKQILSFIPSIEYTQLENAFKEQEKRLKPYIQTVLDDYYFEHTHFDRELSKIIDKYVTIIRSNIGSLEYRELRTHLDRLVLDASLRMSYRSLTEKFVNALFTKPEVEAFLSAERKLVFKPNYTRTSVIIAGGAASGKSSFNKGSLEHLFKPAGFSIITAPAADPVLEVPADSAIAASADATVSADSFIEKIRKFFREAPSIDPDRYKYLLVDDCTITNFAEITHEESSYIAQLIKARIQKLSLGNNAPDIRLDMVDPALKKLKEIAAGETRIRLLITSCAIETAVQRSFKRGKDPTDGSYGRFVPTRAIINTHIKATRSFIDLINRHLELPANRLQIHLISTDGKIDDKNYGVFAQFESGRLTVFSLSAFLGFIVKGLANERAKSSEMLFTKAAEQIIPYTIDTILGFLHNGVTIALKDKSKPPLGSSRFVYCCLSSGLGLEIRGWDVFRNQLSEFFTGEDSTEKLNHFCQQFVRECCLKNMDISIETPDRKRFIIKNRVVLDCSEEFRNYIPEFVSLRSKTWVSRITGIDSVVGAAVAVRNTDEPSKPKRPRTTTVN